MSAKIPMSFLLRYGLPALIAGFLVFKVVTFLIGVGENNILQKNAEIEAIHQKELVRLNAEKLARERQHRKQADEIRNRIIENEAIYAAELASVRSEYADSMRTAASRGEIYERLSQSGATERANLASYATQLDRSLVQGRQVVGELRATVIQRDRQLVQLGAQLQADRGLINTPTGK